MIGDLLRKERERQNLSIKDIEKGTSIRALYINAIEKGEYKTLPGEAYAKGFVRNYANYLGLNADTIINGFNEELHPQEVRLDSAESALSEDERPLHKTPVMSERNTEEYRGPKITSLESIPLEKPSHGMRNAIILIAAVFFLAFGALLVFGEEENNPSATSQHPAAQPAQNNQKHTEAASKVQTEGVEMKLSFTDRCWTKVVVDGKTEFEGTAERGKVLTAKGKEKVHIVAGNAGALDVSLNGKNMGKIGGKGEVVEKTFTNENTSPNP